MNPAQQTIDGINRISLFLNGEPQIKSFAPSAPGQPGLTSRVVRPLSQILDEESGLTALAATGHPPEAASRVAKPLSQLFDEEAEGIALSAGGSPEKVKAGEAVEVGYRHVKTLAAILNEEDSLQNFHINVHEIISLNHPSPQ